MINQQTLQGNWSEIQGKLRNKWNSLTEDDLKSVSGSVDQLVGKIQRKTGETRESIEQFFEQFHSNGASAISQAGETARGYAQQAVDSAQEMSQKVAASMHEGYAGVEDRIRQRPAESLAVCFGVGVVAGVAVSLLLRSR